MQTTKNKIYLTTINDKSKIEVKCSNFISFLIGFSIFFIVFAWDGCFNLQVLFPLIAFILLWFLFRTNFHLIINDQFKIALCIIIVYFISFVSNCILSIQIIGMSTLIRLAYSIIILLYYSVLVSLSYNKKQIKTLLLGNICGGVFIAILIILNFLNGAKGKISFNTVFGDAIEENYTGAILSFELVLAFILGVFNKKIYKKILLFAAVGVMFFGLCLTGSRAALIASVISLMFFLIVYLFNSKIKFLNKIIFLSIIFIAVFFLFRYAEQILPEFLYNRMFGNLVDGLVDSSNESRIALWKNALDGFLFRPFFGYGIGNFNYYVRQIWPQHTVVVAHNTYLDFLVDSGLIGLLLILIMLLSNIRSLFNKQGIFALSCLLSLLITSFIVGGERTFFFWNGFIVLSIISKTMKQGIRLSEIL